jgi:hypothetical protein
MARRNGSAPSFGPGHGHRCAERGAAPGCATTSEGSELTLAKLLPPALVMIAGPQILLRPSSWRPPPNWRRNSAAFAVGTGAAINATVTIAFFASDGASTSSSSLIKSSGRLWRRARRSGAETRSATSLWRCTWTRPTDCTEWDCTEWDVAGRTYRRHNETLLELLPTDLKRQVREPIALQPRDLTRTPTDTEEVTITAITA